MTKHLRAITGLALAAGCGSVGDGSETGSDSGHDAADTGGSADTDASPADTSYKPEVGTYECAREGTACPAACAEVRGDRLKPGATCRERDVLATCAIASISEKTNSCSKEKATGGLFAFGVPDVVEPRFLGFVPCSPDEDKLVFTAPRCP